MFLRNLYLLLQKNSGYVLSQKILGKNILPNTKRCVRPSHIISSPNQNTPWNPNSIFSEYVFSLKLVKIHENKNVKRKRQSNNQKLKIILRFALLCCIFH